MRFEQTVATLTVAHVEDDPVWRDVISRIVGHASGVDHVGGAKDGREGLALCRETQPDVVLVDLRLPDEDGFQFAARLKALPRAPRVLFLSCRTDDVTLFHAWSDLVAGLIWKSTRCAEHLRDAFAALAAGKRYFPEDVLAALNRFRSSPDAFFKILSLREQSLIDAFVRGDSDECIAAAHGISRHTAHMHRKNIMFKLNLHCLRDLMRWGAERGFIVR